MTVRELEAKIRALSDTLKEERASKKKVMIQRGYFMELCDSRGEYAEIYRSTLVGLAGESSGKTTTDLLVVPLDGWNRHCFVLTFI